MRFGTCRLARLIRGRRLDRNPLRRGSDRAETVALGALLAAFLTIAPLGQAQLVSRAHLAEEVAGTLAIALIAAYWLARRMAAWDADWLATGPRWSSRH
jgi:hypothetical protein